MLESNELNLITKIIGIESGINSEIEPYFQYFKMIPVNPKIQLKITWLLQIVPKIKTLIIENENFLEVSSELTSLKV